MKGEGLADLVILAVVPGQTHEVAVQLAWKELPAPDAQLAALAEAEMRIGEVLDGGQIAQISLIPVPGGGQVKGVAAAYNPGPEVLAALVRTTYESVCQGADLAEVDTVEGPRTRVDLHCYVDTDDVVGIAAAYDEVTATRLDFAEIDETRWHVSVAGWSTTDANFRLVSGPLAGRQELFTELTTMARDAGASGIQVVDSMYGISFSGIGIAGAAILTLFLRRQARIPQPLVDLQLFKSRVFAIAITTGLLTLFAWSASAYLGGMYLQSVLGLPVLTAALLALPGAVVLTVTCILTPRLTERIGARAALVLCHFTMAAGLALLLATSTAIGIGWFVAATIVASFGFGISFALVADTAVSAVSPERAGSAGAIAEMSNELGNALGIALLGSVAAFVFRLLGPGVAPTLTETLDAATNAALIEQAKTAFVSGLHLAVVIAVVLCAALGVASLRWVPKRSRLDAAGS